MSRGPKMTYGKFVHCLAKTSAFDYLICTCTVLLYVACSVWAHFLPQLYSILCKLLALIRTLCTEQDLRVALRDVGGLSLESEVRLEGVISSV